MAVRGRSPYLPHRLPAIAGTGAPGGWVLILGLVAEEIGNGVGSILKQGGVIPDHPHAHRQSDKQRHPEQFPDDGKHEPEDNSGNQPGNEKRVVFGQDDASVD